MFVSKAWEAEGILFYIWHFNQKIMSDAWISEQVNIAKSQKESQKRQVQKIACEGGLRICLIVVASQF